jgi:hypothetical protein
MPSLSAASSCCWLNAASDIFERLEAWSVAVSAPNTPVTTLSTISLVRTRLVRARACFSVTCAISCASTAAISEVSEASARMPRVT